MKKQYFLNISSCIKGFIVIIICVIILKPIWESDYIHYNNIDIGEKTVPFGDITSNNSLVQKVELKNDCFVNNIKIMLATYNRINTNKNVFKIYKNGINVFTDTIRSDNVSDNSFYEIGNINLYFKNEDEIYFVLESEDGINGNAITAWIRQDSTNGKLYKYNSIDDSYSLQHGEVTMSINESVGTLKYISGKYLHITPTVSIVLLIILITMIIYLLYQFLNLEDIIDDN